MLQLVQEALDQIALTIDGVVDGALDLAVAASRDVGAATAALDDLDDGARVVAAVGDEVAARLEPFQQDRRSRLVGRLAVTALTTAPAVVPTRAHPDDKPGDLPAVEAERSGYGDVAIVAVFVALALFAGLKFFGGCLTRAEVRHGYQIRSNNRTPTMAVPISTHANPTTSIQSGHTIPPPPEMWIRGSSGQKNQSAERTTPMGIPLLAGAVMKIAGPVIVAKLAGKIGRKEADTVAVQPCRRSSRRSPPIP